MEVLLCERVDDPRHSLFHILQSHKEQVLGHREAEELSWFPSSSNSLWQGWNCGLVIVLVKNATYAIWRVLASSDGISSWTPLKPQQSNPNPNPLANQLWSIDLLTPPTPLLIPHRLPILFWISYATQKLMHIVLLKCQIAFLKFTSCNNQALIGCIPIAAVAVHLNMKS